MWRWRTGVLCGLVLAAHATAATPAIEEWLDVSGAFWQLGPEAFMATHQADGFRWVSDQREAARAAGPDQLRFLGQRVWEAIARFEDDRLSSLTLSLYNRGDAGDLSVAAFDQLLGQLNQRLTGWVGENGVSLRDDNRSTAITIRRRAWVKGPHTIEMLWSFTAKSRAQGTASARPEYVRFKIGPFDPARDPRQLRFAPVNQKPDRPLNVLELRARAQRQPDGTVVITSVPMVDQGQKGYCAAAVAERLLRYYGRNVDQHEIAQIANTDAGQGTAPDQLISALRRIGSELDLHVHVYQDFDVNDFLKLIGDYNRLARRADHPEIEYGPVLDLGAIYRAFDPTLLVEARAKRSGAMDNFFADVRRAIDAGVPLAWSVMLGKVAETPAIPGAGGHLRLIIGYQPQTREIAYSDTWGRGHEQKRLSLENAWMITLGLYAVHPPSVRF